MKIFDISLTIGEDMASYLDDPRPKFFPWDVPNEENSFRSTWIQFLSHTGTHVDSPAHLLSKGETIDQIDLTALVGEAVVIDVSDKEKMSLNYFEKMNFSLKDKIVLLKTGEGAQLEIGIFKKEYLAPKRELARYLVKQEIKAIGIDTLSIDGFDTYEVEVHPTFLEANIPIIEGLELSQVPPGNYFLVCLPLKIKNLDGAPARAILIQF